MHRAISMVFKRYLLQQLSTSTQKTTENAKSNILNCALVIFFCNLMNTFKGCLCVYHLSSYFSLLYITDVFAARTCVTCSFSLIRVTWQLILPLSGIDGASQEEENYPNFCLWVVYDRRLQMSLSGYIPSITVSVHSLEVTVAALNMPTAAFSRFGFKSYLVYMPLNPFLQYSWCA